MICDNIWDVLCRDNPSSLLQFVTLSLITHQAGRVCYLTQLNASKFVSHQNKLECIQQNVLYAFPLSQPASGHYPVCSTLSFYQFLVKHSVQFLKFHNHQSFQWFYFVSQAEKRG